MRANVASQDTFPSAEQIAELTDAVMTLTDQVRCLRLAVNEIEAELGWAIRTKVLDRLPPPQLPCDAQLELPPLPTAPRGCEHERDPDEKAPEPEVKIGVEPRQRTGRQSQLW